MRITYLEHSCYIVEEGETVLIFDYYKGQLPVIPKDRKVYVFASHSHHDHFCKEVFEWAKEYPNIQYILSDDIREHVEMNMEVNRVLFIGPQKEIQVDTLTICTLLSTDEGVAFLVTLPPENGNADSSGREVTKGKVIYHAGDLNWWHWQEEDETYNEMMRCAYQREIGRIEGEHIDVAFVPLDPHLRKQYYWGMDYFMKHTDTVRVFPMHMWKKYCLCEKLKQEEEAAAYIDRVQMISGESEVFEI